MIRFVPYLLYLWLLAMHQVFLSDLTSVFGVTINLAAFLVIGAALYKSETEVCWFGFFVGLVAYIGLVDSIGWFTLFMAFLGVIAYNVRTKMNLESVYSRLLVVFVGVLVHNIFVLTLSKSDNFFILLWSQAFTGAVYTTVIAWIFFLFKEGKITFQKFKAIF